MDGWMDGVQYNTVQYSTIQYNTVQYSTIFVLFLQIMTNYFIYADNFVVTLHYPSLMPSWEGEVRIEARPGLLFTRDIARALKVRMYYYTLFYSTILYSTVLYSTIIYSTLLCCTQLYCTIF